MKINRKLFFSVLLALVAFQTWSLLKPEETKSAALTNASITLSNSRLSYAAKTTGTIAAGSSAIKIGTGAGSASDIDTNHLFPLDPIAVGVNGGLFVNRIVDLDDFTISAPLVVGTASGTDIYATQSGAVTASVTIANDIPAGGYIRLSIPDPASNGNDKAPDSAASTALNGWDLNGITVSDITVSGGTGCTWNATEIITVGSGSNHFIDATTSTVCTAGTISIVIDSSPGLINPAPITSGHSQGSADVYQWNVSTYTSDPLASGIIIDSTDISVAPIEGVLISATVDETLSFTVTGVSADSGTTGTCGITRTASSPDSTSYAVPWGTISSTYLAATHNTSQLLSVSTNADNGYSVTIIANDQMGKDGVTCTGAGAGESANCIQDTTCSAAVCSESTARDWTADPAAYPGLGYSLEEVTASEASFEFDDTGVFFAKQIPDAEAAETAQTIMTNAGPVANSQVYVCYRIDITPTQPAGYYFNKVRYTATAIF